jgi:hypothetical protein
MNADQEAKPFRSLDAVLPVFHIAVFLSAFLFYPRESAEIRGEKGLGL